MNKQACSQCGAILDIYWLRDGICNGCRNPHLVVESKIELHCDGQKACQKSITMIDEKGFIYCEYHGVDRRACGIRCRRLKPNELKTIQSGQPLKRY